MSSTANPGTGPPPDAPAPPAPPTDTSSPNPNLVPKTPSPPSPTPPTPPTPHPPARDTRRSPAAQPGEQLASPLFGTLPLELRAMIFTELFGGRRVHLEFMPHPVRADKVGNRRRWRHGICEDGLDHPFSHVIARKHYCLTAARRRVLDISMLFTCRRALVEALPVLYQSNVFLIINTGSRRPPVDDIRSLQAKIPKHWSLIQSLEIKWEVALFDRNQANMVPHLWGRDAYEALWDSLADIPALVRLRIALLLPRCHPADKSVPDLDMRDLYLNPITRLKALRVCEVVMPHSYRRTFGYGVDASSMGGSGESQFCLSWIEDDAGRVPSGPAVASILASASMALT